jgi:hypothetical protein
VLVAYFVAGLIVGTLLGLALAPVLRSWILWQITQDARDAAAQLPDVSTTTADTER